MKEQWLNKIKERSDNFECRPPVDLWDGIQQSLVDKGVVKEKKQATVVPIWHRWGLVVAAVFLLSVITFVALRNPEITENDVEKLATVEKSVESDTAITTSPSVLPGAIKSTLANAAPLTTYRASTTTIIEQKTATVEASDGIVLPADTVTESESTVIPKTVAEKENDETQRPDMRQYSRQSKNDYNVFSNHGMTISNASSQKSKWSAGLFASNMTGVDNSMTGYGNLRYGASPLVTMTQAWASNAMANIMFNNLNGTAETSVKHHLPVKVGASLKYAITDRWGIESGLTYTMLRSDLTSGGENNYYATEQTLHYIGIPLKASYTVWQNNKFKAYVTAGGQMDVPVSGRSITDYVSGGELAEQVTEDADVNRLQWSVTGAVGAQYDIIDKIGIYVEPGVSYYFDDRSDVVTIYKEKPCNFSLQIGLRLNLD